MVSSALSVPAFSPVLTLLPRGSLPPLTGDGRHWVYSFLSLSLTNPGYRASTASAAAVLSSSHPRHHKSLSTSAHPSPPDIHAHRPRQVATGRGTQGQPLCRRESRVDIQGFGLDGSWLQFSALCVQHREQIGIKRSAVGIKRVAILLLKRQPTFLSLSPTPWNTSTLPLCEISFSPPPPLSLSYH